MLLIIAAVLMGIALLIMFVRTSLHPEFLADDYSVPDESIYPTLSGGCAIASGICAIIFVFLNV